MTATEDIFTTVLSDFKKRLTPKELEDFEFTTLDDVRKTAMRIQKDQEQVMAMMNMSRIQSFLEAMNQFGKVIEVFVNASEFVAFVWGPMKFILQVSLSISNLFLFITHNLDFAKSLASVILPPPYNLSNNLFLTDSE